MSVNAHRILATKSDDDDGPDDSDSVWSEDNADGDADDKSGFDFEKRYVDIIGHTPALIQRTTPRHGRLSFDDDYVLDEKEAATKKVLEELLGVDGTHPELMYKVKRLAAIVNHAKDHNQVFAIHGSCPKVRAALIGRGWLQKLYTKQMRLKSKGNADKDLVTVSQALLDYTPNLVWLQKERLKRKFAQHPYTLYNKISFASATNFTSCDYLVGLFDELHWSYSDNEHCQCVYPRSYAMVNDGDRQAFIDNFRLTICTSFIFFLAKVRNKKELFVENGYIASEVIDFALVQVEIAISKKRHEDIDGEIIDSTTYDTFHSYSRIYQSVMRGEQLIRADDASVIQKYDSIIKEVNNKMVQCFPEILTDGYRNMWLLKSVSSKSDVGGVFNEEKTLLEEMDRHPNTKFIIQKYIERPLIVHNTKFNLFQYFLLTSSRSSVELWLYRDCYLKFSKSEFSLDKLTIKCNRRQMRRATRNKLLPSCNMWSLAEFLNYLNSVKKGSMWHDRIFPGIVESIRTIIKASRDNFSFDRNGFELFNAKLLITSDYRVSLLKIYSVTDFHSSNQVLRDINTSVISDLFDVVLNSYSNPAKPGKFDRIFGINVSEYTTKNCPLSIVGRQMKSSLVNRKSTPQAKSRYLKSPVGPTQIKNEEQQPSAGKPNAELKLTKNTSSILKELHKRHEQRKNAKEETLNRERGWNRPHRIQLTDTFATYWENEMMQPQKDQQNYSLTSNKCMSVDIPNSVPSLLIEGLQAAMPVNSSTTMFNRPQPYVGGNNQRFIPTSTKASDFNPKLATLNRSQRNLKIMPNNQHKINLEQRGEGGSDPPRQFASNESAKESGKGKVLQSSATFKRPEPLKRQIRTLADKVKFKEFDNVARTQSPTKLNISNLNLSDLSRYQGERKGLLPRHASILLTKNNLHENSKTNITVKRQHSSSLNNLATTSRSSKYLESLTMSKERVLSQLKLLKEYASTDLLINTSS